MEYFCLQECIALFHQTYGPELCVYLRDAFGNRTRIDYGTGHEMSFIIFLMGIHKLVLVPEAIRVSTDKATLTKEVYKLISVQLLTIFVKHYLPLVRKIQSVYRLEPAGSHGVFSLDDFQFLPFYFGSSQIARTNIQPNNFHDKELAERYKNDYMFFEAIAFIHQMKTGPFAEHSNQLWNISAVASWKKINSGLLKMYKTEFLPKLQIVQHLYFGPNVFEWRAKTMMG